MDKEFYVELKMEVKALQEECKLGYQKASLFQGVLMQHISTEFAEKMHQEGLKPYSQHVYNEEGKNYWYIKTFSVEAYENIIVPLLDEGFDEFELKHDHAIVRVLSKQITKVKKADLMEEFYNATSDRIMTIKFRTPTSFKKEGAYYFFPDLSNVYGSIMRKYDAVAPNIEFMDTETLEHLVENTKVIGYQLNSVNFSLEGVKIPAFVGYITLRIQGPQTMVNFAKLLFGFATYAGIGIKTAIGMGAIEFKEGWREKNARKRS